MLRSPALAAAALALLAAAPAQAQQRIVNVYNWSALPRLRSRR
jgi:hypothetical protein